MERLGIVHSEEIDAQTLAMRTLEETKSLGSAVIGRAEVCAWL